MRFLHVIVAVDKNMGIGNEGKIPWCVYADMQHFKKVTQNAILIMGRKTWEGVPDAYKNFAGREAVIIVSKNYLLAEEYTRLGNIFVCKSLSAGIEKAVAFHNLKKSQTDDAQIEPNKISFPNIFICGGTSLYREALTYFMHLMKMIYITLIPDVFLCDTFFPIQEKELTKTFSDVSQLLARYSKKTYPQLFSIPAQSHHLRSAKLRRQNLVSGKIKETPNYFLKFPNRAPDQNYVDLVTLILTDGEAKKDRTGVGTLSIFSHNLTFDLQDGFPLLTRRKIFWKGCLEETLFFLKGKTQTKELEAKNVNIWKGNTSREFLDKRGLFGLEEGDMGAGYGFLWRHFGSDYPNLAMNQLNISVEQNVGGGVEKSVGVEVGENVGVDQIANLIEQLKKDPHSRRHIVSAWDPAHLHQCALPPCHILFQMYVRNETFLDCKMTQRSCDVMLGLPFNIASYALLTHILAKKVGLQAGKLHISLGDAHIYANHIDAAHEVVERPSMRWPKLLVGEGVESVENVSTKSIEDLSSSDFLLEEYGSFPSVKMDMAV